MVPKLYYKDKIYDTTKYHIIPQGASPQISLALLFINNWLDKKENFIFFTSGSTGSAKEIKSLRTQIEASANATIQFLQLNQNPQHVFICLHMHTVGASIMLARALLLGANITLCDATANPLKNITHNNFTFASFVPLQIHTILADEVSAQRLKKIHNVLIGGAAIVPELEMLLTKHKNNIWHSYGMTETLSHIALRRVGEEVFFTPLPGVQIDLNKKNCLLIKAEVTNNIWLETNDVARINKNNTFEIIGRIDNVINSGGYKIYPEKIEAAIHKTRLLKHDFFVGSKASTGFTNMAVIAVACADEKEKQMLYNMFDAIKNELQKHLYKYEIPKQIICIDKIFYTPNQKIDRAKTNEIISNQGV